MPRTKNIEVETCETLTPENLDLIRRLVGLNVRISVPEYNGYGILRIVGNDVVVEPTGEADA